MDGSNFDGRIRFSESGVGGHAANTNSSVFRAVFSVSDPRWGTLVCSDRWVCVSHAGSESIKTQAGCLVVGLLVLSIISHLIKGLDYEESLVTGVLLIHLLLMQKVFTAQSDRPSIAQGIRVLFGALVLTLAYGTAGFYLLNNRVVIRK